MAGKCIVASILSKGATQRLVLWGLPTLWLFWLLGQLLRDTTALTALLFYIPSPVLFIVLICGSCYGFRTKQRASAIVFVSLAVAPTIVVLCVENQLLATRRGVRNERTLRLVHWNVFRGHLGWDGLLEVLRQSRPDVCVLSEVPNNANICVTTTALGRDWSGIGFDGLAVLACGSLQEGVCLQQHDGVKAYGIVWQSRQGPCRLLVVDLASSLFRDRGPRLRIVRRLMAEWHPDIVVGDFNAPRRSRSLCPLPLGFVHAYEAVGSGWSYTWPLPCPVYAIDQCIVGERIAPVDYTLESSCRSDHRRQVFDFAMVEMRQ